MVIKMAINYISQKFPNLKQCIFACVVIIPKINQNNANQVKCAAIELPDKMDLC